MNQETLRTILGILTLVGAAIGIYVGIQGSLVQMQTQVASLETEVVKLDKYDGLLQAQVDRNREGFVRVETLLDNSEKNYDRLTTTMDNLGKEIRTLSDTLIRVENKSNG